MVFFSTIIPVFNRASLINATLASVLNQELNDQEIIVVDDGSTDETPAILAQYGDRIRVLHQNNQGPGEARNLGIRHARGQYVTFLDSDDLWFPWTLTTYKQIIAQTGFPAFVAGMPIQFSDEVELDSIQALTLHFQSFSDYYSSTSESLWILPGATAIQTDVLRKVRGFTHHWINGEDSDLWLRLGTAEGFVWIQDPLVLAYRQHPNTAVTNHTKTYQGSCYLIQQERTGQYPGAEVRKRERLKILTRHVRPVSFSSIHQRDIRQAWKLYLDTFRWHLDMRRMRYLIGFPLISIKTQCLSFLVNFYNSRT